MRAPRPSRFARSKAWLIFKAGMVLFVVDGMVFSYHFHLHAKGRFPRIKNICTIRATGVCLEQRQHIMLGSFNVLMRVGVVRFDGDEGAGGVWRGRALFALSPAPATGHNQPCVVAEND